MSLRARVLAGVALIAAVLGLVLVVVTRTTHVSMLEQTDAQLANAVGPVRGFDLGLDRPRRGLSSRSGG